MLSGIQTCKNDVKLASVFCIRQISVEQPDNNANKATIYFTIKDKLTAKEMMHEWVHIILMIFSSEHAWQ